MKGRKQANTQASLVSAACAACALSATHVLSMHVRVLPMQDYAAEAEEARRAAEEVEGQAAQQAEADAQEKANLR
eukprot:1161155-Pelagomonas_calceolata.AAC.3